MKRITTLLIMVLICQANLLFGQSDKAKLEVQNQFWGSNDLAPSDIEIPDKWKNESAVILYKRTQFEYKKKPTFINSSISVRKKILLKDNVAVKKFSEFSIEKQFFNSDRRLSFRNVFSMKEFIGIRVIKPNNEIEVVDLEQAMVVKNNSKYISIPNLQPGDVIDFYIQKDKKDIGALIKEFEAIETLLADSYPIKNFYMDFKLHKGFKMNFKSFNGAPLLQKNPESKKNLLIYSLAASEIEEIEHERWTNLLNELPSFKLQIIYFVGNQNTDNSLFFYSDKKDEVLSEVSGEQVQDKFNNILNTYFDYKGIDKLLKKDSKYNSLTSSVDKLEYIFYYFRNLNVLNKESYIYTKKHGVLKGLTFSTKNTNKLHLPYYKYFDMVGKYLLKNKIPFEFIVSKNRFDGPIEDLILGRNLIFRFKINIDGSEIFMDYPFPNNVFNNLHPKSKGTNAYAFQMEEKSKLGELFNPRIIDMPNLSYEENKSKTDLKIEFTEINMLNFHIRNELSGVFKFSEIQNNVSFFDLIDDERKVFPELSFIERVKANDENLNSIEKRINNHKSKINEKFDQKRKKALENSYGIKIENGFKSELLALGRFQKDSAFVYTADFNLKDQLIKKAGQNYIFEIGKLISNQVSVKEDEQKRRYNVNMESGREIINNISFEIPEGYEIKGLEKLKKNVDNKTGSFISSAKIENGHVVVETRKVYKSHFVPKEEWSLMVEFLDEAFQFSQENVLFRKK